MELQSLGQSQVIRSAADVPVARERVPRRRLTRMRNFLLPLGAWVLFRLLTGHPVQPGVPHLPESFAPFLPGMAIMLLLGVVLIVPMLGAGRSPHVLFRASEIDVTLDDVKGN